MAKQFNVRVPNDELDILNWLENQSNRSLSIRIAIAQAIATYGPGDITKQLVEITKSGGVVIERSSKRQERLKGSTDSQLRKSRSTGNVDNQSASVIEDRPQPKASAVQPKSKAEVPTPVVAQKVDEVPETIEPAKLDPIADLFDMGGLDPNDYPELAAKHKRD